MNRVSRWLTVCVALIAANVFGQVSTQYRDWGNSVVYSLMMKHEKTDWGAVKTDADAKAFIDLFWARRDPTPDTPVNELRQQFETRIADADKRFSFAKTPGSRTARGQVYVLLGEPSQIVTRVTGPGSGSMSRFQRPITIEAWIYRNEAAAGVAGTKAFDILFNFHDERLAAEFELDGPSQLSFDSTALAIAKAVLKRPFLTAAELAAGGAESARTVPLRLIVVGDSTIAHEVLRRAQEGQDFSELARKYSSHPSAQQGGYVGRVAFADLTDDFKVALAGKDPGTSVLIGRTTQFAIVRLLTEAEARVADDETPKPK